MKRRTIELLKTLLIIVLLLAALVLTLSANVFGDPLQLPWVATVIRPFAQLFGYAVPQQPVLLERPTLTDASQPQLITARTAAGRTSWYADDVKLDAAFDALGSFLADALDTADDPQTITARQFQSALREPGVYFEYPCAFSTDVLCAWLDADAQMGLTAARYALHLDENIVMLLIDAQEGLYQYQTRVDAATLFAALDGYGADDTFFAFESSDAAYERLDPLTLIVPDAVGLAAARAVNPCDEAFISKAANLLGFNPYGDSSYRDDLGAVIYTESDCTLRVSADGTLLLRNLSLSNRYMADSAADTSLIEYVRQALSELTEPVLADSRLQMSGFTRQDNVVTIRFDYYLSGTRVTLPDGPAAEAVFSGAALSSLTVRVRSYTRSAGEVLPFLPVRQVAAIARPGGLLRLQYADPNTGVLQAGWTS